MKRENLIFIINLLIVATLCACAILIPYASLIFTLASVGFFAVFTYKNTAGKSFAALAVALAVTFTIYFLFGITVDTICGAASSFCLIALSGGAIGLMMRNKCSYRTVLSGGAFVFLLPFLIEFARLRIYYGVDLIQVMIAEPLDAMFAAIASIPKQDLIDAGAESALLLFAELENMKWPLIQQMASIFPAFLIIICSLCAFLTFLFCRKFVFCRYRTVMHEYPHFRELQLPRSTSWLLTILYVATMFMGASPLSGAIKNIVIIICALYAICAVSVIDFLFAKIRVHWSLRALTYLIAFPIILMIDPTIPVIAGIIDSMFDFRRLRRRKTEI
ncbi:MAG: DUF2232 domain-containing protein [Clostridia bacterium]|nr:DUF2232 domain-containing protein [Clostridia bacterium]